MHSAGRRSRIFQFRADRGASCFKFDLGGKLVTGTYDKELLEQWMLYCPDGRALTYRSDGAFTYGEADRKDSEFSKIDAA